MRGSIIFAAAAAAATLAGTAAAQERTGYRDIAAGRLADAEADLTAQRADFARRPELMLNLAAIYLRTDRGALARALYGDVLATDSVMLDLPDGSVVSSHEVARRGLARVGATLAQR
jgi:hypothetical protein